MDGPSPQFDPQARVVWCDEAGFTGDQLMDPDQPWFSVASVLASPSEAQALLDECQKGLRKGHRELKSGRLLGQKHSRMQLLKTAERLRGKAKVFVAQKDVALAYKFYEYAIEPAIRSANALLYRLDFHRFCGMLIVMEMRAGDSVSRSLLSEFRSVVRTADVSQSSILSSRGTVVGASPWLGDIIKIARACPREIESEVSAIVGGRGERWLLDLTYTGVSRVLSEWGRDPASFSVVFDESQPLRDQAPALAALGSLRRQVRVSLGGRTNYVGWNQYGQSHFAASHGCPGLQLADLAASLSSRVVRRAISEDHNQAASIMTDWLVDGSICEDFEVINPELNPLAHANATILKHLANNAESGRYLLAELEQVVHAALATVGLSIGDLPPLEIEKAI